MLYTHNLLIKNSQEVLKNTSIDGDNRFSTTINDGSNYNFIIMPAFINLHTHLSYQKNDSGSQKLFPWLKELVKISSRREKEEKLKIIKENLKLIYQAGTQFIVENTSDPELVLEALLASNINGIIGIEIFGSDPQHSQAIFQNAIQKIQTLEKQIPPHRNISFTLSPHAIYDVSPELWHLCLNWCQENQRLLLSHLAESQAEEDWARGIDGIETQSAIEFWEEIGTLSPKLQHRKIYSSSLDFLIHNDLLSESLVLAHLCHSSESDLALLSQAKIKLVSCPRSNDYLFNPKPDLESWFQNNLSFGLGTDSIASNYDWDLRQEARASTLKNNLLRYQHLTEKAAGILGLELGYGRLEDSADNHYIKLKILDSNINLDEVNVWDLIMDSEKTRIY